ncbi:hypothetical protein HWA77_02655 [Photobacterium damselae subsp. damselae]|uniref:Uncharacterized protein n=1 Tax=Photobacterium damselae subsp. damselae TaxID=85581 RepID=A0A7Y7Q9L2_PHODD|nr:hypothetical protein [Photobacterium damselae]NVH51643.1 hypothetical protein [Photobacterium damselae subsp. damselae]NVO60801.1 hypothetical protein [Photobacterium damselae subsp. damselae]NVO81191.1 hypothetical protein [Photobacterium damselae subsp. damselae]NVO99109.1 hypothetical protein [Photobacterium damselae subsp. damselae]
MKYIYIIILLLPYLTFAKTVSHIFDVSTIIDIDLFDGESLVITGKNGVLPIDSGELFVNKDGTFISNSLVLEAHEMSDGGIPEPDLYKGKTLWSLLKTETYIGSDIKDINLVVSVDDEKLEVGNKYKDEDSSINIKVENIDKIDDLKAGQIITSVLTIILEPSL